MHPASLVQQTIGRLGDIYSSCPYFDLKNSLLLILFALSLWYNLSKRVQKHDFKRLSIPFIVHYSKVIFYIELGIWFFVAEMLISLLDKFLAQIMETMMANIRQISTVAMIKQYWSYLWAHNNSFHLLKLRGLWILSQNYLVKKSETIGIRWHWELVSSQTLFQLIRCIVVGLTWLQSLFFL